MHRLLQVVLVLMSHAQVSVQHYRARVDSNRLSEVKCCFFKFLLFLEDVAQAEPSVVVALVSFQGFLVAFLGLFKVFVFNILMTT